MRKSFGFSNKLCLRMVVLFLLCLFFSITVQAKNVKEKGTMVKTSEGTIFVFDTGKTAMDAWVSYDEKQYYFDERGILATGEWIGNVYVGADGAKMDMPTRKAVLKSATKKMDKQKKRLIIAGASRVKHMAEHTPEHEHTLYVAKSGAGYGWFSRVAIYQVRAYLDLYPRSTVVFQFGNNDINNGKMSNITKYVKQYKKLMKDYPQASIYVMDALPGTTSEKKNKKREQFNKKLKKAMKSCYIGGYSHMVEAGFETLSDGEHYTRKTSKMIYEYIVKQVGWTLG